MALNRAMADHWDELLTPPIKLNRRGGGRKLETLRETAAFMLERFETVIDNYALYCAVEETMHAAETGRPADIQKATEQVKRVLKSYELV